MLGIVKCCERRSTGDKNTCRDYSTGEMVALTEKVSFNLRLVGGRGTGYADFRGGGK